MLESPLLIFAGFFVAFALASLVIADWSMERRSTRRTLQGVEVASLEGANVRDQALSVPVFGRVIRPAFGAMGRLARRLSPADTYERIELDLVYAGNPPGWDAERIMAFKIVMPLLFGVSMFFAGQVMGAQPLLHWAMVLIFAAAGWYAPEWLVRSRASKRQHSMQLALPDSLDLMSITVEAGLAFDAALTRVSRNIKGPLGEEMYRVVQEIQLGKSRSDALRDLADRSTVQDLKSFVGAMVQADTFGIPIARVLKVQSREIRIRRRQRAEEQAQKLPVKIVFPVVLTIFPALFVVLLGPAAIQIYQEIFSVL